MKHFTIFIIILATLGLWSCKDSEGTIGDSPITANGQDRDSDIITEMTTSTISPSYSMYSTKTAKTRNSIYPMPDSRSC